MSINGCIHLRLKQIPHIPCHAGGHLDSDCFKLPIVLCNNGDCHVAVPETSAGNPAAILFFPSNQIIIDNHFFLHFRVQYDFLTYLAKFQSITNIRSHSFFTFISENLRPPLLDLVPRLGYELEKMTSFSQKYLTG